jgi:hypothetical protein
VGRDAFFINNRPFLTQPPFPCDNPPLFVIPSEADLSRRAVEGSAVLRTLLEMFFERVYPIFRGTTNATLTRHRDLKAAAFHRQIPGIKRRDRIPRQFDSR